jgi:hypothetical protein
LIDSLIEKIPSGEYEWLDNNAELLTKLEKPMEIVFAGFFGAMLLEILKRRWRKLEAFKEDNEDSDEGGGSDSRLTQDEYDHLFDISADQQPASKGGKKYEEALKDALDIRKFEIEMYWKRATYFWTLIGAAFLGYGLSLKVSDDADKALISALFACLGLVLSFAWYCVNRGSKKWQENWENHVDLLEDKVTGPLYKVVFERPKDTSTLLMLLTGPGNFSVSKINQLVSIFVAFIWAILVGKAFSDALSPKDVWPLFFCSLSVFACFMIWCLGQTDDGDYKGLQAKLRVTEIEKE